MTQDKINKAVDLCDEIENQLSRDILHTNAIHNITELNSRLKSLLQSDNEGREVVNNSNQYEVVFSCPSCECFLSQYGQSAKDKKCIKCGQKLIWPENQKKGEK